MRGRLGAGVILAALAVAGPALAQNPFATVARVDGASITEYDIAQRSRFLQLLGAPGGDRASVIEALVQDKLRLAEARRVGAVLGPEALQQGLEDFAARANLTADEFTQRLGQAGVDPETFRNFVVASLTWRDYIRARFGARVQITPGEIDRAVEQVGASTGIEVLLSEIIIPAPPARAAAVQEVAERIAQSQTQAQFSAFARQYSATATRGNGGRLNWLPISDLPASLRPILLALGPDEVTSPLPIPNAVALFQLRDIRETNVPARRFSAIEYAALYLPGGRTPETLARAQQIADASDRCDDLYGPAKDMPENALERGSLPPDEIPQDIAIELAKLDPGETSTNLTRSDGATLVLLMLCGRSPALDGDQEVDREAVAAELRNQRLTAFSDNLLAELESAADIVYLSQ